MKERVIFILALVGLGWWLYSGRIAKTTCLDPEGRPFHLGEMRVKDGHLFICSHANKDVGAEVIAPTK